MNIYKILNDITLYIEEHLGEKIDYAVFAKMMGVNVYTMQRVFSVITNITLAEYIRKRRLSVAASDLINGNYKVIDIALKYGYENATSFSRAFVAFHGIKPSKVGRDTVIKEFPRMIFDEAFEVKEDISYTVVSLPKMELYGLGIETNNLKIKDDAPNFFAKMEEKYSSFYGDISYGLVFYTDAERCECCSYYCLYDCAIDGFQKIDIPESKWLKFEISSQIPEDIQGVSQRFYKEFFPSCRYNLRDLPELEHYHDGITDFLIPIE